MKEFLAQEYYGNTVENYLITLAIIVAGFIIVRVLRNRILIQVKKWAEKTETKFDDYLIRGIEKFGLPALNILVLFSALHYLTFSEKITKVINNTLGVVITFYIIRMISAFVRLMLESFVTKQEGGQEKLKQLNGVMLIINGIIWILGLLFLFDNLGYNVTTIVAGLGIGGIAIALAAQNILGDLFNYFVIFFDRPFEVGDSINVDGKAGTVEYIGIKTTRVRSLTGEQLVFANSDLTKSRIHNFKRMDRRRVVVTLGVVYETTHEQLAKIPPLIEEVIKAEPGVTFDRAHFSKFGAYSLDFEVVYFVESAEYLTYMNVQQAINLKIFKAFEDAKIGFAYPTQTILVSK
ncbi:MAG: mechanosensitive ion channel family protein [Bacteroidetes bacterium CHB5]|nr:mechanosensitive ion channel family protein [Bacteroidetes bacterium CHB5]